MAYAGGRHPSVPPSAPPSDVSSQGVTCFLGVMGGRRMEDSRALTTVIFFPGKVGGSGGSLRNMVEGAVLHHLGGQQQHQSCLPLP